MGELLSLSKVGFLRISRKSVVRLASRVKSGLEFVLPDVSSFAKCLGKFMGESSRCSKSGFWHIFDENLNFSKIFKIGTPGRFHTIKVAVLVYRKSAFQTLIFSQNWINCNFERISRWASLALPCPLLCLALPSLPFPCLALLCHSEALLVASQVNV